MVGVRRITMPDSKASVLAYCGKPSVAEVRSIIEPLAHALEYVHAEGVIHSDLKPENICLSAGANLPQSQLRDRQPYYNNGRILAEIRVTRRPVSPITAVRTDQVFSVSSVVSTLIFENTQNPLLFIQSPTSDPLPITVAR